MQLKHNFEHELSTYYYINYNALVFNTLKKKC